MNKKKVKVSACIITYNHEKFIRNCLDAAVKQKLDFDYEIIIGEDKSTDNTLTICKEYEQEYPNLIKVIDHTKNLGMIGNWIATLEKCTGDYIALCEGDDFWTDNLKLQKQVTFLVENEKFTLCGTKVRSLDESKVQGESEGKKYGEIVLDEVLRKNQFTTCTAVLKKSAMQLPPWQNFRSFFTVDWPLWCSLLKKGKGYNFNLVTAQYNIHSGGATSGRNRINTLKNKLEDRILMIDNFPHKKSIIKKYGIKIIFHYTWKSLIGKKDYYKALVENKKLVKTYMFY